MTREVFAESYNITLKLAFDIVHIKFDELIFIILLEIYELLYFDYNFCLITLKGSGILGFIYETISRIVIYVIVYQ